jgi:hypothetical protein
MANFDSLNRMFLSQRQVNGQKRRSPWQDSPSRLYATLLTAILCFTFCLAFCLVSLLMLPAVSLADSAPTAESMAPLSEHADIAASKVDQFAQAYLQVLELLSDREPELPAAETSAEALKIQQSIEADAVKQIENSGLTMAEYMKMLGLASQDEAFRDKVLSRLDESLQE